ncbi:hypothetical protein [Ekhidna sp. To15]|uniref:hypothetical protein n=1 Tax=Ekhidna sp. To15 TaxID=3395267 RepID=UPI003F527A1A
MKKILLSLSILSLLLFISCGSDDGPTVNNQITVGDQTFDITNGGFIDLGESEGTRQGVFALADADISITSTPSFSVGSSSSFRIVLNLVALGSTLSSGTYTEGDVLSPDAGRVFFVSLLDADGTSYTVDSGSVEFSGTDPNFTMSFNLTLNGGTKMTGGFSGEFATAD